MKQLCEGCGDFCDGHQVVIGADNDEFYGMCVLRDSGPTLCRWTYCYTTTTDENKTSTYNWNRQVLYDNFPATTVYREEFR